MRILILNDSVELTPEAGEQIHCATVRRYGEFLYADEEVSIVDFDIFILDADRVPVVEAPGFEVSQRINERVEAGGCLILFPSRTETIGWTSFIIRPRGMSGSRVRVPKSGDGLIRAFDAVESSIPFRTEIEGEDLTPLLVSQTGHTVAGLARPGDGLLFVLPEWPDRSGLVRRILSTTVTEMLPQLRPKTISAVEAPPEWVSRHLLPGVDVIEGEIAAIDSQVTELQHRRLEYERNLTELTVFWGLLWLAGPELEIVVKRALQLLGIDARPRHPVDLVVELDDGDELYIEIEGTVGAIQLAKGRQLLDFVLAAPQFERVKGAIIGNPFRREPLDRRPPSAAGQRYLFSPPLENLATRHDWALVPTSEVFGWVQRHLGGDLTAALDARHRLGID